MEYNKIDIQHICSNICSGGTPKSTITEYYGGNIPWLNTKEINFNRISETEKTITDEGLNNSSAKWIPAKSVIVAMYGATAGKTAITQIPLTTNQACCNLTIDSAKADYRFVYYALYNDYTYLASLANGGAQQNLNAQQIKDFEIPFPSLKEQKYIANILSSLDDKIELNRRINDNLEQQAQALFKSWFVDFEPFKDGKFVDSELGMIPEGWRVGNLLDIAKLYDAKRKPLSSRERENMKKIYPYYGATSIMDYVDKYIFDGTYLLMGEDGSVMDDKGYPYLQYVFGKFWSNNHAHVMQGKNNFSTEMLHSLLLKKNISPIVTGAVQAKISQANMRKILITQPPHEITIIFSSLIKPIYEIRKKNELENQRLSILRDTLLPKLMSGELKINDINN